MLLATWISWPESVIEEFIQGTAPAGLLWCYESDGDGVNITLQDFPLSLDQTALSIWQSGTSTTNVFRRPTPAAAFGADTERSMGLRLFVTLVLLATWISRPESVIEEFIQGTAPAGPLWCYDSDGDGVNIALQDFPLSLDQTASSI